MHWYVYIDGCIKCVHVTLQEEKNHWNLNFAILLFMANSLNSAYYSIFRNLSMIAYIIEIHKSKFANIKFREFYKSEPGC